MKTSTQATSTNFGPHRGRPGNLPGRPFLCARVLLLRPGDCRENAPEVRQVPPRLSHNSAATCCLHAGNSLETHTLA